jgi:chemotaxis protein methyltransferase CheR
MPSPSSPPEEVCVDLRRWVEEHSGIHFPQGQEAFFDTRLRNLCRAQPYSFQSLRARVLAGDSALGQQVMEAASTGYTEIFREREIFDVLTNVIFPTLGPEPIRIWSAAASTGEEVYSIGMSALEYFGNDAPARVRILGTDLNATAVAHAERGEYAATRLASLGDRLTRYFEPSSAGSVRAREQLRALCTFRRLNLMQPHWPFAQRFHVIFLRNILYYFEVPARRRLLEACYDAAAPGGWLLTSFTEPVFGVDTRWTRLDLPVFRKEGP